MAHSSSGAFIPPTLQHQQKELDKVQDNARMKFAVAMMTERAEALRQSGKIMGSDDIVRRARAFATMAPADQQKFVQELDRHAATAGLTPLVAQPKAPAPATSTAAKATSPQVPQTQSVSAPAQQASPTAGRPQMTPADLAKKPASQPSPVLSATTPQGAALLQTPTQVGAFTVNNPPPATPAPVKLGGITVEKPPVPAVNVGPFTIDKPQGTATEPAPTAPKAAPVAVPVPAAPQQTPEQDQAARIAAARDTLGPTASETAVARKAALDQQLQQQPAKTGKAIDDAVAQTKRNMKQPGYVSPNADAFDDRKRTVDAHGNGVDLNGNAFHDGTRDMVDRAYTGKIAKTMTGNPDALTAIAIDPKYANPNGSNIGYATGGTPNPRPTVTPPAVPAPTPNVAHNDIHGATPPVPPVISGTNPLIGDPGVKVGATQITNPTGEAGAIAIGDQPTPKPGMVMGSPMVSGSENAKPAPALALPPMPVDDEEMKRRLAGAPSMFKL